MAPPRVPTPVSRPISPPSDGGPAWGSSQASTDAGPSQDVVVVSSDEEGDPTSIDPGRGVNPGVIVIDS